MLLHNRESDRLAHMDALCSLSRGARRRGNGWAFGYPPFASYLPSSINGPRHAVAWR